MVRGVLAGLRTLVWAIILLSGVTFCIGMLMRQTLGEWCNPESIYGERSGKDDTWCPNEHLLQNSEMLFSTVPRACFTVFRCLTEGCVSVDGTPLMVHVFENSTGGSIIVVIYLVTFVIVTFGLFNLIMSVFVENTMEHAKLDETKRRRIRQEQQIRLAQKVQEFFQEFIRRTDCSCDEEEMVHTNSASSKVGDIWAKMLGRPAKEGKRFQRQKSLSEPKLTQLHAQISRKVFGEVIETPQIQMLLKDLEVSVGDPMTLFDVLDADEKGYLDMSELIKGILRLRGTADKSDVVAALLTSRAVHKSLRGFEIQTMRGQQELADRISALGAVLPGASHHLPGNGSTCHEKVAACRQPCSPSSWSVRSRGGHLHHHS